MAEKVVDINVTEETNTNEQAEQATEKTRFEKAYDYASGIGSSLMDKARDGIAYVQNNPAKVGASILGAWGMYKTVVKPVLRDIQEMKHECTYYDRYGSQHVYECKRKLTNNEMYQCDEYVRAGGNAYEWLKSKRLVRK